VPMVLFFLPGLFVAILTPAIIQINHWTWTARRRANPPRSALTP